MDDQRSRSSHTGCPVFYPAPVELPSSFTGSAGRIRPRVSGITRWPKDVISRELGEECIRPWRKELTTTLTGAQGSGAACLVP